MSSAVPGSAAARDIAYQHAGALEGLAAQATDIMCMRHVDDGARAADERVAQPSWSAEHAHAGAKRPAAGMTDGGQSDAAEKRARVGGGSELVVSCGMAEEQRLMHTSGSPIIMVQIGAEGLYADVSLTLHVLQGMRRMDLLEQLATSVRFAAELKDVPLSRCTVWLLPRVAGKKPTNEEEAAAVELEGADTLAELLAAHAWMPARLLFLRVRTPRTPAVVAAEGTSVWTPPAPDDAVPRVVSAIRSGQYEVTVDGHINLTLPGVTWPELDSPLLFVRSFYNDLYERVMGACAVPKMLYLVTGQPGIGKSAFGLYVLFRAVKAGRSVVYASHKGKRCFEIPADTATVASILRCRVTNHEVVAVSRLLEDSTSLAILDGCSLPERKCATLQVASPRLLSRIAPREDTNSNTMTLTIPVYSYTEMLQLRQLAFKHVTESEAMYRMSFWGHIPRLALAWSAAEQQERVDRIGRVNIRMIMAQEVADVVSEEVSHTVFIKGCKGQVASDVSAGSDDTSESSAAIATSATALAPYEHDYYLPGPLVWASLPIMNSVLRRATAVEVAELCAKIRIAQFASTSVMSATNGDIFESLATILLHSGGDFRLIKVAAPRSRASLSSLPSEVITVRSSSPTMAFDSADDLRKQVDTFKVKSSFVLHARSRKECAVDGIIKADDGRFILYNTTFSTRHPLMLSTADGTGGIIPIAKALGLLRQDDAGIWTCDTVNFAFLIPANEPPCFKNVQQVLDCESSISAATDIEAQSNLVRKSLQQHIVILPAHMVLLKEAGAGLEPSAPVAGTGQYTEAVKSLEEFANELRRLQRNLLAAATVPIDRTSS